MRTATVGLRIMEKATRRTWRAYWPYQDGAALCVLTGHKHIIQNRAGYSETNDRGEPVLDSWVEPTNYISWE